MSADLVRLLHEIDGQLGLAVYRGEGKDERWIKEADALIGRIRQAVLDIERPVEVGKPASVSRE